MDFRIWEEIDKEQDKQNPAPKKENGDRYLASIRCYFPLLAIMFCSKFQLQYKAQPLFLLLTTS